MSRLVAAITRTSTLRTSGEPTRCNSWFCTTRSSLLCVVSGMSAISSRNTVPPCAYSNRPTRSWVAPVNAPFTWPNSSLSNSVSTIAEQLQTANRRAATGLSSCNACATSSLPVPVAPPIKAIR
jgi:hypothetical protein